MNKFMEYSKLQQLIEEDNYDSAYGQMRELRESDIDIRKIWKDFKDNIMRDEQWHVEPDTCGDGYTVTKKGSSYSGDSSGSGTDGPDGCCGVVITGVAMIGLGAWCCSNPEGCSEGCADMTVDCCCGCCCGC